MRFCTHPPPLPCCSTSLHALQCRYHYNVANTRVDQHVEKGNDDGLYISSVACCQELWALIMDAGTGFSAQVHNLSNQFLPKVSLGCPLAWASFASSSACVGVVQSQ